MAHYSISPAVLKRVSKELQELDANPPEGIKIIMNEDNILDVQAWIQGPDGTPYQGGCFKVKLILGPEFPTAPPKGYFASKIFHPNVSSAGEICVNTLKKDWKKELGISHILLTIKCLLIVPNPESALNEEAGKLLLENYESFAKRAKLMTEIHSMNAKVEFRKSESRENFAPKDSTTAGSSSKTATTASADEARDCNDSANATGENVPSNTGALIDGNIMPTSVTASPKKRAAEKKLEKSKTDKKRNLKRL